MKKLFSLLLLCMLAITGRAAIYVDEITPSNLSGLSTTDQNFTVTGGQSGVEYKIIAKKGVYNGIAFSNSSGLFTAPIPDLYVKKIEIEYTSARPSQTINVYGKNVAYINLDDVFTPDEQRRGINLGTLNSSTSYLNVSGNYKYFAFAPTGDFEVSKIIVTWEGEGSDVVDVVFPNEFSGLNGQSYAVSSLTKNSGATYTICALETPGSDFFTINDGATTGGKYRGLICNNPPGKLKSLDIVCMATSSSGVLVLRGNSSNYDSSMSSAITGGTVIEEYLNLTTGTPSAKVSTFTDSQDYAAYSLVSSKAPKQIYKMTFKWEITDLSIPSAPMFSPAAGAFSTEQIVTLSAETGAVIKYSFVNNTDFSTWSTYTGPITVDQTKTIYAVAIKDGNVSSVASAEYIIGGAIPPAAPTFNPTSCSFVGSQSVEINCATEDASIEYSFDGSTWSEYSTALTITDTKTIYARATHNGDVSAVASATYTKIVPPAAPTFSVAGGTYNEVQTVAIACATEGASVEYSFDNTNWTTYTEALTISETKTLYARAAKDGLTTDATPQTYTIILPPAEPTFSPAGGMYSEPQTVSISAVDGAVVKYSFSSNSYDPEDDSWVTYTSPLTVSESKTIYAVAIKDGLVSGLVSANYVIVRDYTFDYRTYGYDNQTIIENKTDSDNRFFINICEGSEPKYSTPSPQHVKLYSGNKIEIASKPGYVITKIEFGLVSQNKMNSENTAVTKGVRSYDSNTFSITSNDTNPNLSGVVVENISSSQTRFTTIKIYYDVVDVDIEVPIFSVEAGNVDKGSSLSISSEAGTTLKYTINGGETQTASGNSVDIPFDAVGEKTIRAWAEAVVNGETKSSAVVEKTYNVQEYIPTGEIFTKVTSATQLQYGDRIIIACESQNRVLGGKRSTDTLKAEPATIANGRIDYDSSICSGLVFVLRGSAIGGWWFECSDENTTKYLTAKNATNSTKSNSLNLGTTLNENSKANITIYNGNAVIEFAPNVPKNERNRNTIKYNINNTNNGSDPFFSAYLSSSTGNQYQDVQIYRAPGTATLPSIPSLDVEAGDVVNGTVVTATSDGAQSIWFKFVPYGGKYEDEEYELSSTGKYSIPQSGTLYAKGYNGLGYGEEISRTYRVLPPAQVEAYTNDLTYSYEVTNMVVKGTVVEFRSEGANDLIVSGKGYDSYSITVNSPISVTIFSRNTSGDSQPVTYSFSLVTPSEPMFSVKGSSVAFTDGKATIDYGANVNITSANANEIRYTVYAYEDGFDINNPGTPVKPTTTVQSESVTYKVEEDVVIVACGLAGGIEGPEICRTFLYARNSLPAPVFSVPGGIHIYGKDGDENPVFHTLKLSHKNSGAEIWYYTSLDEDAPNFKRWDENMENYGIVLDRSMTVYAYAKANGNESEVVSSDYTIRSAIESLAPAVDGELSPETFNITGTSYTSGEYISSVTGVPYAFRASTDNGYLKLNSATNAGIVSTFHTVGYVKKIEFMNHPSSGLRTKIRVYGSNNAYINSDDLFSDSTQGEIIGELSFEDSGASEGDWVEIPRIEGKEGFEYKYIGICAESGTLYANFRVTWSPIQYNVGDNEYSFVDENGYAYSVVNITDADYNPLIVDQVVKIPSSGCPEYMVPYGARLRITAPNASHIRYSYTEDIADAVNSAETAINSTIEVPMTESHYVFAQGLIIGGERGTILGTNTRDFIRVRVKPSTNPVFFPDAGLYRSGTQITGKVPNATDGTCQLVVGGVNADVVDIDENGEFTFTLTNDTDMNILAKNDDCKGVNGGNVSFTITGANHDIDDLDTYYNIADDNSRPSTPISNIPGGGNVKKGTTLNVLIDGAIYVRYLIAPPGTDPMTAQTVVNNWSTVQDENYTYMVVGPEGFVEGVTDLTTIDAGDYVETFDYTIEDDCVVFASGFNAAGQSDVAYGSFKVIRPQSVSYSYPSGPIVMGSQVRMLCPGADEIYYELTYLDSEGNPINDTPITRTVVGDVVAMRIQQPVKITAWGVISGASSLEASEAVYTISADKIYRQLTDLTQLKTGDKVIFGAYDVDNSGNPEDEKVSYVFAKILDGNNIPGMLCVIEDQKIANPSDVILELTVEVLESGSDKTYAFYTELANGDKMYLNAPNPNKGGSKKLIFVKSEIAEGKSIFGLEIYPEDYQEDGSIYAPGDVKMWAVDTPDTGYKYIAFNHTGTNNIFNAYLASTIHDASNNSGYYGIEMYVLDPDAKIYPPVTPVFDPEIGGSYPQGTEITIFSAGASTLYYTIVPDGTEFDESTGFMYVNSDMVVIPLTTPGTYYAYGTNSAGMTEIVSNYYSVSEPGSPEFIPDPAKYHPTDRLVDVGTKVTIRCANVEFLEYVVTDKATGNIIDSDLVVGLGDGEITEVDVYVLSDCYIEATGVLGTSDEKTSTTEFRVNNTEDRIYHQISSIDEIIPGEEYIIATVSSTGTGLAEVFSGNAMGTITGSSIFMDSYDISNHISRRNNGDGGIVEITNPPVGVADVRFVSTGNSDKPYAITFVDKYREKSDYLVLSNLDSKLEMELVDVSSATEIPALSSVSIEIDGSTNNATIYYGDVNGSAVSLKYNGTGERFKAYRSGTAVQIYKRVYIPTRPVFEPNGGYYNIKSNNDESDFVEVKITSKYADKIEYMLSDGESEIYETEKVEAVDGSITISLPIPESATTYVITAYGYNGDIVGDSADSMPYYFGNTETYILIDNMSQVDKSFTYDGGGNIPTDNRGESYIIAYNHSGNLSAVRALAAPRADGMGIGAYNVNIAEDVVSIPFTTTQVMRLNLFYTGSTPNTYAYFDNRRTVEDPNGTGNPWTLKFDQETGKLCVENYRYNYFMTIDEETSNLELNFGDNIYLAYYVPGGYFVGVSREVIEVSSDYEWPQLFRTNLYRLVQPRVSTKKDADTSTGNYAIGQRFVGMSNKAAILSDYNTEKSASYADAVAAGITYRYTMDGSMPTMDSPELGDGFVFSPGFNDDGTLQELTMKLRIMAFNNDPAVKHSKSSVLQTYTSGIHVKNIAEYKAHADDKEHLYVIDGNLGVAFAGYSDGKAEYIVFDNSSEDETFDNSGEDKIFNYLLVQAPAADGVENGGDNVNAENEAKNAWQGMHGYHADFEHIDLMSLTKSEMGDDYFRKLHHMDAEGKTDMSVPEVDVDDCYYIRLRTLEVDEDANGNLKANHYQLYPNADPEINAHFECEVVMANRYNKIGGDMIYSDVEGYVFGRENPVLFVTAATPKTYYLAAPELYIYHRGPIGNELAGGFEEGSFKANEGTPFTIDTPFGFNYIAGGANEGFEYNPDYMDIFYSKDGTNVTLDNIINLGWKEDQSLVGQEETEEITVNYVEDGEEKSFTFTDYNYHQTAVSALPDADKGIFRYKGPFYVSTKGWTHTGSSGTSWISNVTIKALCILHPTAANRAHLWTPFVEVPVNIWDVDYAPAPGNNPQSVRRRIIEDGVYKTAKSDVMEVNSGITTNVDRIMIDGAFEGEPVYFNLQGVRMPSDKLQRGIYIKVCGASASKVFVK